MSVGRPSDEIGNRLLREVLQDEEDRLGVNFSHEELAEKLGKMRAWHEGLFAELLGDFDELIGTPDK